MVHTDRDRLELYKVEFFFCSMDRVATSNHHTSSQIKSNQIKSNQIKSNQIKPNQKHLFKHDKDIYIYMYTAVQY